MLIFALELETIKIKQVKTIVRFTKMHGAGNDYIYINATETCPDNLEQLAIKMSDRHKGVGSDGLIAIMKSDKADFRMRMFNADGSEGEMCGNASRCIAKYVFDKGLTQNTTVTLETLAGIKILKLKVTNGEVEEVTVDMGEPCLEAAKVPVISSTDEMILSEISTSAGPMKLTAVSMGNPHGVIFVDDLSKVDVHKIGRELEVAPMFPKRANIEFAQALSDSEIRMRVWERGSGETMACGTGACATAVAGVLAKKSGRDVTLHLLGGDLRIRWDEATNHVFMTGGATTVFEGEYYLD